MRLKLSELCDTITGRNIDKKKQTAEGTPYITGASNIQNGKVCATAYVDETTIKNPGIALKGDIIVSCVGTLGKIGLMDLDRAVLSGHVFALRPLLEVDTLYLIAMLVAALQQELPDGEEAATGFSNKLNPADLQDVELNIPEEDEQRFMVLSLVRFAITQVASNLSHITGNDVRVSINVLNELTARCRKALRKKQQLIDEMFDKLYETCVDPDSDNPDNPFNILRDEQHRIQNLLKIM